MVEMELRRITINDTGDRQYIVLGERFGERSLTIVIGYQEAQAIDRFVKKKAMQRPMTHDLMASLLLASGAQVDRIDVMDLRDGTFYAEVKLTRQDGTEVPVDARPSDAIALATAMGKPIYVSEDVLEAAAL